MNLENKNLLQPKAYINGDWVGGDKTFEVKNPSTGEVVAEVTDCDAALTKKAIDAAYEAFPEWAAKTVESALAAGCTPSADSVKERGAEEPSENGAEATRD